jgi:hypothetical protein
MNSACQRNTIVRQARFTLPERKLGASSKREMRTQLKNKKQSSLIEQITTVLKSVFKIVKVAYDLYSLVHGH